MSFNPKKLYLTRVAESRAELAPYFRYVFQSGLLFVLAFIGIVFVDQYINLFKHTPANFPLEIVTASCLVLVLLYTPFRSYLKPADIIYLMPKQVDMVRYLQYCTGRYYIRAMIPFVIVMGLSYVLLGAYDRDYGSMILLPLLTLKIASYHILVQLSLLINKLKAFIIRLVVYGVIIVVTYFIVSEGLSWIYFLGIALLLLIYFYVYRQTSKFFNWSQLIHDEQTKKQRIYRMLNWFVDVPRIQLTTQKRTYLAMFSNMIRFSRENTFSYLHFLTFARSEVGGIFVRNILVGCFIAFIMSNSLLWDGWGALIIATLFIIMNAIQLSALRDMHQYSVWQNIYPIPLKQQHKQMTRIEMTLLLISAFCLTIVPSIPLMIAQMWNIVAYLFIATFIIVLWRLLKIRAYVKKKLNS